MDLSELGEREEQPLRIEVTKKRPVGVQLPD